MLRVQTLLVGIVLISSMSVLAQEKEVELDPVTVTSTLSSVTASKTGRNIVIIKGDEFSRLPVNSLDDLLRYVPGIEVQQRGPMGAQSDIVIRGGTFQQVLVVIDGVRLNDPNTGHFSSYIPIAPSEIERIEVLKGASSAIYGSDAVGGVIHIITKAFAKRGIPKQQLTLQQTSGEYGLQNFNGGGFFSNDKTAISAGFLSNNATGQLQRGTRGFFHLHTASLSASHNINNQWQIALRSSIDSRDFSAQNFYTRSAADTAREKVQTYWNQLRLAYEKQSNKLSFHFAYKAVEDNYRFNSVITPNNNKSKLFQALTVYEHNFGAATTLVGGAQIQNRQIRSNDRGNHDVKQAAGFALLQQQIGSSFHLSPALRVDWDERSGTELVPQLNLSYKLSKLQLRASAGKTIRQADFTERFNNYNKATVASQSAVGNPDLTAEYSFSYEAGADLFAGKNVKLSGSYFQREYNDLIDYVSTPYNEMPRKANLSPAGTYAFARNIADVSTKGFETDLQYVAQIGNKHSMFATLGLLWVDSKISEVQPSLYLTAYARFLTNFSLRYSAPGYSISVNGLYKNRKPQNGTAFFTELTKDYFLLNAKAEAFILTNKLSAFVQLDNIFDRKYTDVLGTIMPGRWLMGGMKLSLSK